MKLRLDNNSLRLRVRKSDLQKILQTGATSEKLIFPSGHTFEYTLSTAAIDTITAAYTESNILVNIPLNMAKQWINSDEVGLECMLSSGLFILIEKDFPCKDRPWEDISDTFFELVNDEKSKC